MIEKIKAWLLKHKILKQEDWVQIRNRDVINVALEGPLIKMLLLPKNHTTTVKGPIPEFNSFSGEMKKWDAIAVVEDMLISYAKGLQPGVNMTDAQARIAVDVFFQLELIKPPLKWWWQK
jgi:hypothetical protein